MLIRNRPLKLTVLPCARWNPTAPWVAMQPSIACFQVTINLDELTLGTHGVWSVAKLDCHPILAGNTASFGPLKFPIIHLYRTLDPAWLCPWRKTKHCMPWTWTMNISRQKCHFEPKTRGIHWERQYTMYTHQDREYYRTLKKSSPFSKFLQWYNVDIWAQILLVSVPNNFTGTENFFVFGASCPQQSALIPEVLGCATRELPVTLPIFSYSHWRQMVKSRQIGPLWICSKRWPAYHVMSLFKLGNRSAIRTSNLHGYSYLYGLPNIMMIMM